MSEIEVPIEKIQADIEHVAHGGHHEPQTNWITWSALLSAVLAVLAAIAALHAGHQVNEAMVDQMKASDSWNYYQAKSIKQNIAQTKAELLVALGKESPGELKSKIDDYANDQKEIQEKAKHHEEQSEAHFHKHEIFAQAVTFFQIAIAVTAIAVLARRRKFLWVAVVFGIGGAFYVIQGFLTAAG